MAGTRKSTRQSTKATPKYADDDSSLSVEEAPKRNTKKPTRRKRAREVDDEDDVGGEKQGRCSPSKKAATSKSKPMAKSSAKQPNSSIAVAPPAASTTNRDAAGNQQVYWLFKAEPHQRYENGAKAGEAFSIDDLAACTEPEPWSGVRNPQACSIMKEMRKGDLGFFYHSNAKPSGVVGMLRVVDEAVVDESAFQAKDPYYDPKSHREKPRWFCVRVEFVKKFEGVVDLHKIKSYAVNGGPLANMQLVKNSRLSVGRVTKEEWDFVLGLVETSSTEPAGA
jgi:predicted RNA-binding protein with PUA-like domain